MTPVRFLAKKVLLYGMMGMLLVACSAVSNGPKSVTSMGTCSNPLEMDGNWDIHVQLLDGGIHIAKIKIYTPA
jgi:hypothetical protein